MNVFYTVDVEVWCNGWTDLDAKFPRAFEQYVYGPAPGGERGLRYQAKVLADSGLTGVFFVEPLFALRFGLAPLQEIVGVLRDSAQEVQLHMHPEWVDEITPPPVPVPGGKRPLMRHFSRQDQSQLIAEGLALLRRCGIDRVDCFRAGSFGFDVNTLAALRENRVAFDASYNAAQHGPSSGVAPGALLTDTCVLDETLTELPMTVFDDGFGRLRHAQLGACAWSELERMLWQGLERGQHSFVMLSHNFELLSPSKTRSDPVVDRRFRALCRFLDRHRDRFRTRGFRGLEPASKPQPGPLQSTRWRTGQRTVEQVWRRVYR